MLLVALGCWLTLPPARSFAYFQLPTTNTTSDFPGLVPSGINGCGLAAVNPVSSATCPYTIDTWFEEDCPFDKFVLVQTTGSGHYWAVKANSQCDAIATPESTGLVPCLATDAFDSIYGCYAPNPPVITVEDGFIKLDTSSAPPSGAHCDESADEGRMVADTVNGILYICTAIGWEPIRTDVD